MNGNVILKRSLWFLLIAGVISLAASGIPKAQEKAPASQPMVEDAEWDGVKVELMSVERTSGNMLTIKFKYINGNSKEVDINRLGRFNHDNMVDHVYYVDTKNKKKYLVVKDAEGKALGTNLQYFKLSPNESKAAWGKFPEPPADVQKIAVYLPGVPPFEDVPIR